MRGIKGGESTRVHRIFYQYCTIIFERTYCSAITRGFPPSYFNSVISRARDLRFQFLICSCSSLVGFCVRLICFLWWPPGGPSGGPPGGRLQRAFWSCLPKNGCGRLHRLPSARHQKTTTKTRRWHFHGGLWISNLLISYFKYTILSNNTKRAISGVIWTKFSKLSLFEPKYQIAKFDGRPTLDCGEAYSQFHHILPYSNLSFINQRISLMCTA